MTQVENIKGCYIVGVYFADGNGGGQWVRLRNFGERQGDAFAYRDYDVPKLTDAELRLTARAFKMENRYKRVNFKHYDKERI